MTDLKVIKMFRDKDTQLLHNVGDEIKKTNDRAAELSEGGYVEIIESAEPETEVNAETNERAAKQVPVKKGKPTTKEEKKFE